MINHLQVFQNAIKHQEGPLIHQVGVLLHAWHCFLSRLTQAPHTRSIHYIVNRPLPAVSLQSRRLCKATMQGIFHHWLPRDLSCIVSVAMGAPLPTVLRQVLISFSRG